MVVPNSKIRPFKLPEIELFRPCSIDEALGLLDRGARLLAGGTDLLIEASQHGEPGMLAWIGNIDTLGVLGVDTEQMQIGAGVTLGEMLRNGEFRRAAPAVAQGAQLIGSVQLRNQATLMGNICSASPAGDCLPGLLVHDARVEIVSPTGRRTLALEEFLLGPGDNALAKNELAVGVALRPLGANEASSYRRHTERQAIDLAFACVAVRLAFEADGHTVADAHLALGAVGPWAFLARQAAAVLVGFPLTQEKRSACAELAAQLCQPISDFRASADYRRQLIRVQVDDILAEIGRLAGVSNRRGDEK